MKASYKVVTLIGVIRLPPSISKLQVAVVEVNVVAGTIRDPTLVPGEVQDPQNEKTDCRMLAYNGWCFNINS